MQTRRSARAPAPPERIRGVAAAAERHACAEERGARAAKRSRRAARAAAAAAGEHAYAFPQLPLPLVLHVFALLPADVRLRCAEVSRAWRETAALPALWARLDLSPASGVAQPVSHALLRAALARARRALTALDVSGMSTATKDMCSLLRTSRSLVELHLGDKSHVHGTRRQSVAPVARLLAAAPRLRELHVALQCSYEDALEVLESRPAFASLRVHTLVLWHPRRVELPHALLRALADERLQPCLARLMLFEVNLDALGVFDALADAVVCRRLTHLAFHSCRMPLTAPALARALRDGAITDLQIIRADFDFIGHGALELADAMRASSTLTSLTWWNLPVHEALLGALVGHRSLRALDLSLTFLADAAVGSALGALVAADAPALTELIIRECHDSLGEAGLGPLCDALPSNTHLRTLTIGDNHTPAGFMRARLLPAVRANTGLRKLEVSCGPYEKDDDCRAAKEAESIVKAR